MPRINTQTKSKLNRVRIDKSLSPSIASLVTLYQKLPITIVNHVFDFITANVGVR